MSVRYAHAQSKRPIHKQKNMRSPSALAVLLEGQQVPGQQEEHGKE